MTENEAESALESAASKGKRGRKVGTIYFPRDPLKSVLPIPEAIWKEHTGNPFDILDVAKAVGQSPTSSKFIRQLASSFRYGLTLGSPSTKLITLTALGSAIVAPTVNVDVNSKLREALLHSEIFRKVYTWMDRKPVPNQDIFKNTLVKPPENGGFDIPKEDVDDFVRIFNQNVVDYGLVDDVGGTKYLRLDKLSPVAKTEVKRLEVLPPQLEGLEPEASDERVSQPAPKEIPKQVFVAHGKNKKPLEQLERILTKFKVPYKIAIEEPNRGLPVSAKVAELMRQCTSGIFVFTGDEETQDAEGKKYLRPSDNVVFELGAASVLYGNKIVIFKEEGVSFASDFKSIGYISFEKDKLEAKTGELISELIELGFLQLTPT